MLVGTFRAETLPVLLGSAHHGSDGSESQSLADRVLPLNISRPATCSFSA